jgi:hypothetical protein
MVVIAIIAALAAILLPVIGGLLESARTRACQRKMDTYSKAFYSYKSNSQNKLPALFRVGDPGMLLSGATIKGKPDDRLGSTDPAKAAELRQVLGSNAMQNVWLLLDGEYMGGGEDAFKCPGDGAWKPRNIPAAQEEDSKFGWTDPKNFSYGLHFPYEAQGAPGMPDATTGAYPDIKDMPKESWNFACPNGIVTSAAGDDINKAMYPDNCIYLADRNPRRTWEAAYSANSNHEEGLVYLEKGGSCNVYKGVDGKAGYGRDDVYQNRDKSGGLPVVSAEGKDVDGLAKAPCTDTAIWPLDTRTSAK